MEMPDRTQKAPSGALIKQVVLKPVVPSPPPAALYANHIQVTPVGGGPDAPDTVAVSFFAGLIPLAGTAPPDEVEAPLVARIVVPGAVWREIAVKTAGRAPREFARPRGRGQEA